MVKTITVGRATNNDKQINNNDISGQHARITDLGNGEYKIEDLDSTNGTYVNGYRIKTATVSVNDQVRLSADMVVSIPELFGKVQEQEVSQKVKTNPKDYVNEFAKLEKVYRNFIKKKRKLKKAHSNKQSLYLMVAVSIPVIIGLIIKQQFMSLFSLLFARVAQSLVSDEKFLDTLEELDNDFKIRFVCPNHDCPQSLAYNSWTVWHNQGECPRCKAVFNKNKL